MDTVDAITQIASALHGVSATQGIGMAEVLFGRYGAQTFEAISNNAELFKQAMLEGAQTAAEFEQLAPLFERLKFDWELITNDVTGIYASIAGDIGPELDKILKNVHSEIGSWGTIMTNAFADGKVLELLTDVFDAAWEAFRNYGEASAAYVAMFFGESLATAFATAFADIPEMVATAIANAGAIDAAALSEKGDEKRAKDLQQTLSKVNKVPDAAFTTPGGLDKYGMDFSFLPQSEQTKGGIQHFLRGQIDALNADANIQQGTILGLGDQISKKAKQDVAAIVASLSSAMGASKDGQAAFNNVLKHAANPAGLALMDLIHELEKPQKTDKNSHKKNSSSVLGLSESHYKLNPSDFEKMGFIFTGKSSVEDEKIHLLRRIARGVEGRDGLSPTYLPPATHAL